MIGNDIIDLQLAAQESDWQRKGFLQKIFTASEQNLILSSKNYFQVVWRLWSMKESAYKIHVQQHSKRFFAPQKFECFIQSKTNGMVCFDSTKYLTTSVTTPQYIYSIATTKTIQNNSTSCFKINSTSRLNQRQATYHNLKSTISNRHKTLFDTLALKKNAAGVPSLYQNDQILTLSFSISHHGNYGLVSIQN
ncbi:4'-phosphopantetheinyl transferase superfamily protein [Aquimarina sp. 2201CG1-2-11]|uniref:4'-phosphopantetheinyl transferase family protein n=1 Tax=Aquimarina discodermiae TaxID=3231043 RepID=UPI0034621462